MKGREAAADAVKKPSERYLKAKASIPEPAPKASDVAFTADQAMGIAGEPAKRRGGWGNDQTDRRDMWVFKHITAPMTTQEIIDATKLSPSSVTRALEDLLGKDAVRVQDNKWLTCPSALHSMGWTKEMVDATGFPGRGARAHAVAKMGAPSEGADALAVLAGKTAQVPSESLDSYRRAFEDLSRLPHYGIKEIDDVTKAFVEALRRRMSMVRYDCPTCGKAIEVQVTRLSCRKCGYSLDVGDLEKGLRLVTLMKEV